MILKGVWSVAKKKNKTNLHLYQLPGAFQMSPRERIEPTILEADDPTVNKIDKVLALKCLYSGQRDRQ